MTGCRGVEESLSFARRTLTKDLSLSSAMPWIVTLSGSNMDLEELPNWLHGGEFCVAEVDGNYELTSDLFEALDDPSEIRRMAEELVSRVNGLARIMWSKFQPVDVSGLRQVDADRQTTHHHVLAGRVEVRTKVKAQLVRRGADGSVDESDVGSLNPWLKLAVDDELVERALLYLNRKELTWHDLSRALEVVKSDVGGRIEAHGWASRNELSRFSGTANSYSILGHAARHGRDRHDPIANPMSFTEARRLVLGIVRAWLEDKSVA